MLAEDNIRVMISFRNARGPLANGDDDEDDCDDDSDLYRGARFSCHVAASRGPAIVPAATVLLRQGFVTDEREAWSMVLSSNMILSIDSRGGLADAIEFVSDVRRVRLLNG